MTSTEGPEPSGYELQRSINRVEQGLNSGLTDIKVLIAGLVSRDLFDYEAKTQNARMLRIETDHELLSNSFEEFKKQSSDNKWRIWAQIIIPILAIAVSVAIVLLV